MTEAVGKKSNGEIVFDSFWLLLILGIGVHAFILVLNLDANSTTDDIVVAIICATICLVAMPFGVFKIVAFIRLPKNLIFVYEQTVFLTKYQKGIQIRDIVQVDFKRDWFVIEIIPIWLPWGVICITTLEGKKYKIRYISEAKRVEGILNELVKGEM